MSFDLPRREAVWPRAAFYGILISLALLLVSVVESQLGLFTERYLEPIRIVGLLATALAGLTGLWLFYREISLACKRPPTSLDLIKGGALVTFFWALGASITSSVLLFAIFPGYADVMLQHMLISPQMADIDADMVDTVSTFMKRMMTPIPMGIMSFVSTALIGCVLNVFLLITVKAFPFKRADTTE